ncbi:MAG: portal protein [Gammaproteobacteria bacterium]|nr:portal protein [Gammaproteobacteria bacterium]|tara:strand:- start:1553 stop:3043 length:1491 start_codon:yes stop_codon:yes gene_type:complete
MAENDRSLFGFQIKRKKTAEDKVAKTFTRDEEDGSYEISPTGGYFGQYLDINGDQFKTDVDLILKYRQITTYPEIDAAIEDIVNESITKPEGGSIVELNTEDLEQADNVKKLITEEFDNIVKILDFNNKGYDLFRRWYTDGRLFFHVIINEKGESGIKELKQVDPTKIRKVKEVEKVKDPKTGAELLRTVGEYYLYQDDSMNQTGEGLKISPDAIIQVNSGLLNEKRDKVIGYLHKALKPMNQLSMMEDSMVIYRISRAPERRIFYIDVGNLPKGKAEEYLNNTMNKYRNKIVYDPTTGDLKDERDHKSIMEDFWLPRREGGRGTEITTLPGGQNLGEVEDVQYFQTKLYRSLNVPMSRLENDAVFQVGRSSEITRDELKFQKFIDRIRIKFNGLFMQALERQLILKKIIVPSDWPEIKSQISIDFSRDNHYAELKDTEVLTARLEVLALMDEYVGTYYSKEWVKRNILRQDDDLMKEIEKQNEEDPATDEEDEDM